MAMSTEAKVLQAVIEGYQGVALELLESLSIPELTRFAHQLTVTRRVVVLALNDKKAGTS